MGRALENTLARLMVKADANERGAAKNILLQPTEERGEFWRGYEIAMKCVKEWIRKEQRGEYDVEL